MAAATLKSIAKASGFSVTTVSRALGGYDDVNEHTRQIILEEARRQGYEPHLLARLLQGQRSQTLCLVVPINAPRFLDPFFSEFVAGVGHEASSSGFDLLLSTVDSEHNTLETYRRLVAGRRVDGFILTRTHHDDPRIRFLAEKNQPFVVFGRTNKGNDFAHIDVEGDAGQAALTEHFIAYCHRRIGYIAPPPDLMFTHLRLRGFREGMARHHLPVDENWIVHGDLTERGGYVAAQRLLDVPNRPTAIMTGNDLMAFGAMRAIEERELKVGDDIAVGGFDDIPLAELVHPTLTTIRQPIYEIGRRLASTLVHMLAGEEIPDRAILLRPELIIRESSGVSRC